MAWLAGACGWAWFWTVSIYVYINCLNISLVNSRRAWVRARVGPKSGLKESKIVEPGLLGASLTCTIGLLRAKSLIGLLKVMELYGIFV